MHPESTPAEQDRQVERAILGLLMDPDSQRPWAVDELARELGDQLTTGDALVRLHAAGLIHRLDRFVFASRASLRGNEIAGGGL
ncbi:MAG: hypothetical protein KGJ86_06220 [Chloroflexota bacterium]|nr:hypothetical protein [Chloroflexota bacterium]